MPPLPADSIHARACKLKCEKILTRPSQEGRFLFNCHDRGMKAYLDRRWNTWGAARLAERV